jgi:hypothetical protein
MVDTPRQSAAGRELSNTTFSVRDPAGYRKTSSYRTAAFQWTSSPRADLYRVFRAENADASFTPLVTLAPETTSYTDHGLKNGSQYFYEVEAVYGTNRVRSAPFAMVPLANSNSIENAGFEQNDNSHWDKWFSDYVSVTNVNATSAAFGGRRAMQIKLSNSASSSTISQFNQYGIPDNSIPCDGRCALQLWWLA